MNEDIQLSVDEQAIYITVMPTNQGPPGPPGEPGVTGPPGPEGPPADTTDLMQVFTVPDYAAAIALAIGNRPKKIRVLGDTDGLASTYEYYPDSMAENKLEWIVTA